MNREYRNFNLICLALSVFFGLGIMWVWRGVIKDQKIVRLKDQEVITTKDQMTDNNDLSILPSSSPRIVSTTTEQPSSTIPKTFTLAVPFTSQAPEKNWSEPWQDACEEAAILMLDAYYKHYGLSPLMARDEILKLVSWEENKGWGTSIPIEDIKKIAEEYFFMTQNPDSRTQRVVKIVENPTVEQIKKFIVSGNPVLAVADGKVLPNPNFKNGGPVYHALIIKGYDEANFITNDPGTQFGENFKYKYNDLLNAIHDWNNGDVKNGKKVILVIE